jgi:hypothetical protein
MRPQLAVAALVALVGTGCGDNTATSPTSTSSTTATTGSTTFTDSLDPGGSRFYSFTLATAGSVTALLASVTAADTHLPLPVSLEIGVGIPAGTDCAVTTAQMVAPGLVSQMTVSLSTGTYCLRVADVGELTAPATFAVRFTHP